MKKLTFAIVAAITIAGCTKDGQSEHEKAAGLLIYSAAAIAAGGALGPF